MIEKGLWLIIVVAIFTFIFGWSSRIIYSNYFKPSEKYLFNSGFASALMHCNDLGKVPWEDTVKYSDGQFKEYMESWEKAKK